VVWSSPPPPPEWVARQPDARRSREMRFMRVRAAAVAPVAGIRASGWNHVGAT
jgi:hypothetical protein